MQCAILEALGSGCSDISGIYSTGGRHEKWWMNTSTTTMQGYVDTKLRCLKKHLAKVAEGGQGGRGRDRKKQGK